MYLVEALNYVETIERMEKLKTIEQWAWSAHFSHCTTYLHLNKELPQNSTCLLHSNYKLIYVHLKTNKSILFYVTLHDSFQHNTRSHKYTFKLCVKYLNCNNTANVVTNREYCNILSQFLYKKVLVGNEKFHYLMWKQISTKV